QGAPHQLAMAFGSAADAGPGPGPAGAGPGTGPGAEPGAEPGTGPGAKPGTGRGASKPPTRATPRSTAPQPQPSSEMVDESWHDATRAVDRVRARFGPGAVGPAALLDGKGLRLKRAGDTQWGPTHPPSEAGETGTAEP
ncbi:MAG: polymerase, partial [Acidimicrobiaceae bacterium]|nr:polymerase [Acidimicrobiaceae bacterium]